MSDAESDYQIQISNDELGSEHVRDALGYESTNAASLADSMGSRPSQAGKRPAPDGTGRSPAVKKSRPLVYGLLILLGLCGLVIAVGGLSLVTIIAERRHRLARLQSEIEQLKMEYSAAQSSRSVNADQEKQSRAELAAIRQREKNLNLQIEQVQDELSELQVRLDSTALELQAERDQKEELTETVQRLQAASHTSPDRDLADYSAYIQRGDQLYGKGQLERAIAYYSQAIGLNRKDPKAYVRRGNAFLGKRMHNEGLEDAHAAIRLDPRFARRGAWVLRANCLAAAGSDGASKALESYKRALEQQHVQKDFATAIETFKQSMALDPIFPCPANDIAWLYATCRDRRIRNGPLSVLYASQANRWSNVRFYSFVGTLAAAHAANGDFSAAIEAAQDAYNLAPPDQQPVYLSMIESFQKNTTWTDDSTVPIP